MSGLYSVMVLRPVHENQISDQLLTDTLTMATHLIASRRLSLLPVVNIKEFSATSLEVKTSVIINWALHDSKQLSVRVETAGSIIHLSKDKTYLLAGMTGDLGRSVCCWMITHGARHVSLTSRSPNIRPRWLGAMAALGAKVVPMKI